MKTLASPLIAAKNITIHKSPDRISSPIFSSPMENLIMEIVTITNIRSELMTYLFLISDLMSFLNIVRVEFIIDKLLIDFILNQKNPLNLCVK